ncbi:unnamed protein product, partial [Mesorhabditis spiculigera]
MLYPYDCVKKRTGNGTDCTLALRKKKDGGFKEFQATVNQGCFEEGPRVYCPFFCPDTVDAYSVAKVPQYNHKCVNLVSYKSEKRDNEWYFWREGECLQQEMSFEYGCHFTYPIEKADVESFFRNRRRS